MSAHNTAPTPTFNNDTYRSNEVPDKTVLKFRIAFEYTSEDDPGSKESATNYMVEHSQYRLTNQFRQRAHSMPSVIEDIKQKFSGIVTEIDRDNEEFTARISDLENPDNPDELVTLDFDEIQETDQHQFTKGDSFIWYIGYVEGEMISREGFSKIRFRHLPAWSQQEIDTAACRAEELAHFFHRNQDARTGF